MIDQKQAQGRALQPKISVSKRLDPGFELHTFDNLVDLEGNPISVKVPNEHKASFEAAKEAGKRAVQSFKKMFP